MARNYAQISTAMWRNDDFRTLSMAAQHLYMLLSTQADISAAGVLSLNAKRWSTRTKGVTTDDIVNALHELQAHRFIIFDTDTEELLVRSFVRWDAGYSNPKRRPVIMRAAKDIESPAIRRSLAAEFQRLELPTEGIFDDLHAADDTAEPVSTSFMDDDLFSQLNRLSPSQSPSDGVVVTKALVVDPSTHNPHTPSQATATPKARPTTGTRLPEDWIKTDEGRQGMTWAKQNYPHVPLVEEALKFSNYWLAKTGKDATKLDWYKTFQNWVMEANRRLSRYGGADGQQPGRMSGGMAAESNAPKAVPVDEKCPRHRSYRAATCGPCKSEQKGRPASAQPATISTTRSNT